ncbi:DUF397 domain-containing protein [Streptomyces sp. NPDC047046]|uniref:DUF397 domain-containing protein n=1 Tax=Streptomyces sp. NPDC047046 TaxID=3155378 RepID=UPI0033C26B1D
MDGYRNGIPAGKLRAVWVKSKKSNGNGQCVEVAALRGGQFAFRNSTDPEGPALIFTTPEMDAFLDGARKGEFDAMRYSDI